MIPSDNEIREQYYLVSRGVRPMALLGSVRTTSNELEKLYSKLQGLSFEGAGGGPQERVPIGFVVQDKDCMASVGFAARGWVPETLKWLIDNAPPKHLHRLVGLLLGYSIDSIAVHDEFGAGSIFHRQEASAQEPPQSPL